MNLTINELIAMVDHDSTSDYKIDQGYCRTYQIESTSPNAPFYVEPDLTITERAATPAVVLISAPAAVGKTALARHLQRLLVGRGRQAIYVPLRQANIGEDFFTGRLAGVFPDLSKHAFLNAIFSGQVVLLFDGYDEVTMRSDQVERNRLFIAEIVRELDAYERRNGPAKTSIFFLFRSVFSEFGVFDLIENRAVSVAVQFFDLKKRERFLREYLDDKVRREEETGLRRNSTGHLAAAFLSGFEERLRRATENAEAFFGHAIVLSAFGDYLHEQEEKNAARLAEALAQDVADESTSVKILSAVIHAILTREVTKFPQSDYASIPNFLVYPVELQEQLMCAVAEDLFRDNEPGTSGELGLVIDSAVETLEKAAVGLPPEERDRLARGYREELERRVNHHPFLDVPTPGNVQFRNPVYREFYLAKSVAANVGRNWDALVQANDASHYLALFFLHHVNTRDLRPFAGFLFHFISLLASASKGNDFLFKLTWDTTRSAWIGAVESPTIGTDEFILSDQALIIEVPRRGVLQNVAITGNTDCIVGIRGPGHEAGYEESIVLRESMFEAGMVSFSASALRFESVKVQSALIELEDTVSTLEGLDSVEFGRVAGVAPKVKRSPYVQARWGRNLDACAENEGLVDESTFQKKMSKMLLWFRKHGRQDYACYGKKFQTCALNNNQDKQAVALADFLYDKGIIKQDGSIVVLDQTALSTYDIAYLKQNELAFGAGAKRLFADLQASTSWIVFQG